MFVCTCTPGYVGIFDATNTTRVRRAQVIDHCKAAGNFQVVFIESICTDASILDKNYRMKLGNDDYRGMDPAAALEDFLARVAKYESVYEPMTEDDLSYIKLYNVGEKVLVSTGAIPSGTQGMRGVAPLGEQRRSVAPN